ncbi:formate dehydrogenase subunit gamma [Oceaniglobus roseus]|uniref:formate dehydrogenase subunit gamma n=1 Tax=Oceaniglobus roseus TaxID=1737570 RepID=UPI000C7EDCEC|nr:formate dehydrogenase subunit gamma [Kandeliimicrobium roseum]
MLRLRHLVQVLALICCATVVQAQSVRPPGADTAVSTDNNTPVQAPREAGDATPTLADILARQAGLDVSDDARKALDGSEAPPPGVEALGTRGPASDADLWRGLRFDTADISTQAKGPAASVLVQDGGMWWLNFRQGPLQEYGLYLLGGTLVLLALFFLIRGRIRIEGPKTGRKLERFKAVERFSHWLLASSFILLGLTGLYSLFGRKVLIPAFGHEAFASSATVAKWIHDNVSWAFMVALVLIFVMWVFENLPHKTDIKWLLKGGGIFGKGHPPAWKFNAGQKLIFWSVVVFGASISVSGLSMLFPFQFHLFSPTFAMLNDWGVPGWFDLAPFPVDLTPQEEMQYAQLWHAIVALVLTAIIFAHIYIGTIGMEGAFEAMGSGEVEEEWAKEHHSLWAEEVIGKRDAPPAGAQAKGV